jgi:Glycosyltransferase family 28 C-terminal domain
MSDAFLQSLSLVSNKGLENFAEFSHARRTLKFIYFDAGGGHRSAATALRDVVEDRFSNWRIELVNLSDILCSLDPVHRLTDNYHVEDIYNGILKRGWTYGFSAMLRGMQKLINFYTPEIEGLTRRYWQRTSRPDLVVSFIPHFNKPLAHMLDDVHPFVPYVTIMTDLADYPPRFWQECEDRHIICGSDNAVRQAQAAGYGESRIFKTSGMILKPHFYSDAVVGDRRKERKKLGLNPDLPTALIMFGGNGAKTAAKIVDRLSKRHIQSIVMCGRNEKLRKECEGKRLCHAVGFTDDKVPYYMRLADFFIGKPGPGSLSEALHMGLPVIIEHNARTMPQELYNVTWVRQRKLGMVVKSFAKIADAAEYLLEETHFNQFRQNARCLQNRAVYEIPDMLEKIMNG